MGVIPEAILQGEFTHFDTRRKILISDYLSGLSANGLLTRLNYRLSYGWEDRKEEKGGHMRALDCQCGKHLEGRDDEELYRLARDHVDRDHFEMELSDEQVRGIVELGAYDKEQPPK